MDALLHLLEQSGAKSYKNTVKELNDPTLADRAAEDVLWLLHQERFMPAQKDEFWLSDAGQELAGAIYRAHQSDLISPADAGRLLYPDAQTGTDAYIRYHVSKGRLRAIPRPSWTLDKLTEYQRGRRGNKARVPWMLLRSEVERLREELQK